MSTRGWKDTLAPHFVEIWEIPKSHHAQRTRYLSISSQELWFLQSRGPQSRTSHSLGVQGLGPNSPGVRRAKHAATWVQNTLLVKTCRLTSASGDPQPLSCKMGRILCLKRGCEASMFVKAQLRAFWSLPQSRNNNTQTVQVGHVPMSPILVPSGRRRCHSEPFFRCEYRGTAQSLNLNKVSRGAET